MASLNPKSPKNLLARSTSRTTIVQWSKCLTMLPHFRASRDHSASAESLSIRSDIRFILHASFEVAAIISGPAMILEDLGLPTSNRDTVADCAAGRHLHDRSLATGSTTPPQCQRGCRLAAVTTCLGMLHCRHSLSNSGSAKDTASRFFGQCKGSGLIGWAGLIEVASVKM